MTKRTTPWTDEEKQLMERERQYWLSVGTSTERANLKPLEKAWTQLYAQIKLPAPKVVVVASPAAAMKFIAKSTGEPYKFISPQFVGAHEAFFAGWYRTAEKLGVKFKEDDLEKLAQFEQTILHGLWAWPYENAVVVSDRPTSVHYESIERNNIPQIRLHNDSGPSMEFSDGYAIYSWHGISVDKSVIMSDAKNWKVIDVLKESNTELRRIKIERMGGERLLEVAKIRQKDDFGTLWELPIAGENPYVFVEYVNSTPEPDGSFKHYFEAVPPETHSALEGVSWQFSITPKEYILSGES